MPQIWNEFNSSYLKNRFKRPEFWNFEPDQAFGANMVKGSENINPNANRDASNAKFGILGKPGQVFRGPDTGIPGAIPGLNIGQNIGSQDSAFGRLLGTAGGVGSNYLSNQFAKPGAEWLKNLFNKPEDLTGAGEVLQKADVAEALAAKLGGVPVENMTNLAAADLAGAGAERLAEGFHFAAPDPWSIAASVAPTGIEAMTGSKTAGNVVGAAAATGIAGAQGGTNVMSDLMALYSYYKMFKGFF